jgi:DNA-binding MarR family transcriptional regulator
MDPQRPIGFWLKLVDGLIDERFASTLEEHGVTRRQWQLLNVLSRGPATVEQLDAAVAPFLSAGTDPVDEGGATAAESSVEHLSELIESAWVDATAAGYELTERGRTAFDALSETVGKLRAELSDGLTPEQYQQTVEALERMARNLGWSGD